MALAFLRVVQEALHNAAKHSRAKNITVRLNGSAHQLSLEIRDDGVGFDMETAKLAAGLGLISMRERIHLIGGEFDIVLQPRKRHENNSPRANSPGNRLTAACITKRRVAVEIDAEMQGLARVYTTDSIPIRERIF